LESSGNITAALLQSYAALLFACEMPFGFSMVVTYAYPMTLKVKRFWFSGLDKKRQPNVE